MNKDPASAAAVSATGVPETMQAVFLTRYGPPDVLQCGELPVPAVKEDQVLIAVHAASVNPIDWRIRCGSLRWLLPARFPIVLGYDVSGVVAAMGRQVTGLHQGDEVFCHLSRPHGGGYAQFASTSADVVVEKPRGCSHDEAAAVPLAACTALQAMRDHGRIQSGMRVLVNGASGGVGTFAVQIARNLGAEVTGVCGPDHLELVGDLGASQVIDYRRRDFTREDGRYEIVFDAVSKTSYSACRRVLTDDGCYIRTVPDLRHMFRAVTSRVFGSRRSEIVMVRPDAVDLGVIVDMIEAGRLRPIIQQRFPLHQAPEAHRLSESGHVCGKLILQVAATPAHNDAGLDRAAT